jgi:cobalt-zinc-cadmium efflux system outer membrane protein
MACAGVSFSAQAAETPSFATLLGNAQSVAPQLLGQAAETRAARADAQQARAWINPTLSATAENLGGSQPGAASRREDTYSLTQVFEIGGKRAARIAVEQNRSLAADARERQVRISFATQLAVLYAGAEAAQMRRQIAEAELARAQDDLRAGQALVEAGREAQLRVSLATASVASAQAALESAAANATEALERLSAFVGAPAPFTRIDHPLLTRLAATYPAQGWTAEQSPALTVASAERDAVRSQLAFEQKRWYPDIGVSVGVRKFAGTSENAATIGLSASIPLFDRNRAGISAARERAASADYRVDAARLDANASHRAALAQVAASDKRLAAAEAAEAAAAEAYRLGRIGYDAGKASLPELLAIRRALSDAQTLTVDARLARVQSLATLSMAEGRLVFGEAQ